MTWRDQCNICGLITENDGKYFDEDSESFKSGHVCDKHDLSDLSAAELAMHKQQKQREKQREEEAEA